MREMALPECSQLPFFGRRSTRSEADPLLFYLSVSAGLHTMQLPGRNPPFWGRPVEVTGSCFGKKDKHRNLMLLFSASFAWDCFSKVRHWASILSLPKPVKTSNYSFRQLRVRQEAAALLSWHKGSSLHPALFSEGSSPPTLW